MKNTEKKISYKFTVNDCEPDIGRAVTMASHNGLSNGVNGTADVAEVEPSTPIELKSVQNVSINSEADQNEVSPATIVETEIQQKVIEGQSEVVQPEIHQPIAHEPESIAVATPQAEEIATLPQEVTTVVETIPQEVATAVETIPQEVTTAVETIPQEVTTAVETIPQEVTTAVETIPQVVTVPLTQNVNGGSASVGDASPQPQVILETPAITREVKDVSAPTNGVETPVTKLPGSQPGTSDFQVPLYAINALNRIAKDEGFSNYVIDYDRGSNFGDGFVAEIVRAKIIGNRLVKGVQEESELVLIVKLPPENKARREQMGMNVFEREVTVYNEILPMFQKFQLDKGLKPGQGFVSFPKCYFASYDKEKDEAVIIMEDIRKKGFKMLNKYKTIDFTHATAVLETVAQFHGLSLAMKDQCPGIFEKFKGMKDAMADGLVNDMMKSMTIASCEKAIGALEPHEENIKQKLRAFSENIIEIVTTSTNGELSEPYTVINHGDCWTNNMMFKYERGNPRHICLLDWQITRYASPAIDICYFIYQCTDSALRAQHFDNLIQGYHIALRKQVELLGSDVNQILPFTALLREIKSKAKFALSMALFIIPMLCTPNAELPNMDDLVETMMKGEVKDDGMFQMTSNTELVYKKRMGGIVRDLYKKGYL